MNSWRKVLSIILIVLLIVLVFCILLSLGAYVFWAQPIAQRTIPPTITASPDDIKATLSAYDYQKQDYLQNGYEQQWLDITGKEIETDPKNGDLYYDRASVYHWSAKKKLGLQQSMELEVNALADADKAVLLSTHPGDAYVLRSEILRSFIYAYPYRADQAYFYRLAIENLKVGLSLGTPYYANDNPEAMLVNYEIALGDCDTAMADATRLAAAIPVVDTANATGESLFETVYDCQENYQKALEYHDAALKKSQEEDRYPRLRALYLYQLGKPDEALDILNEALSTAPNSNGLYYFLRAAIEYDLQQYKEALIDAEMAENNVWASGSMLAYFEGLEAARLGRTNEAINKLKYAEATLPYQAKFAIQRARAELKKLNAEPIQVTPSIHLSVTPLPPFIPQNTPTPIPTPAP